MRTAFRRPRANAAGSAIGAVDRTPTRLKIAAVVEVVEERGQGNRRKVETRQRIHAARNPLPVQRIAQLPRRQADERHRDDRGQVGSSNRIFRW